MGKLSSWHQGRKSSTARSAAPQSHFTAKRQTRKLSNSDNTDGYEWPNTGRGLPWTRMIVHEVKR